MSFNNTKTPTKPTCKPKYIVPRCPNAKKPHVTEYHLTPEQEKEFSRLFPIHSNARMMKWFGISFSTLQRFKRKLGLTKNMTAIRKELARDVKKICEKNGYYDSMRGKAPSQACKDAAQRKRESGFHPMKQLKKNNIRRYNAIIKKRKAHRLELEESERKRLRYGLPMHTKLHRPEFKYTKSQIGHRYSAVKKYGYILGDKSDKSGERYVIFYDDQTKRSELFEKNCIKDGFIFKPDEPVSYPMYHFVCP